MATPFHIISDSVPIPTAKLSLDPAGHPRPEWLRVKFFNGPNYQDLKRIMRTLVSTRVRERSLPNMGECGNIARRRHDFGKYLHRALALLRRAFGQAGWAPDDLEPERVAEAAQLMGLRYAGDFRQPRRSARRRRGYFCPHNRRNSRTRPGLQVEVLIPDFRGDWHALETVVRARPDVLNHNTETVPRLYRAVRKGAIYERSLESCAVQNIWRPRCRRNRTHAGPGRNARGSARRDAGSRRARHGYPYAGPVPAAHTRTSARRALRPSREFAEYKKLGEQMGFAHVESGPLCALRTTRLSRKPPPTCAKPICSPSFLYSANSSGWTKRTTADVLVWAAGTGQRKDIRALRGEILHRGEHFLARFAQAQHESCFRRHLGRQIFCTAQEFERALVNRALAHARYSRGTVSVL